MSEPKFKVGDEVIVTDDGWGMLGECRGNRYTIVDVKLKGYFGRIGYKTDPEYSNGSGGYVGENSFELHVPKNEDREDNPNIKMIETFVPTWAKWMAMNSIGQWHVFSDEPKEGNKMWVKTEGKKCTCGKCDPKDIEVPWQETLHEV